MSVRLLLLTEDGSPHAPRTLRNLVERIVHYLNPDLDPSEVVMEGPSESAGTIMSGNRWRDRTPPHDWQVVSFVRELAATISRQQSFVVMHHDGDEPFSRRGPKQAEYDAAFERLVVRISQVTNNGACRRVPTGSGAPQLSIQDVRQRLLRLVPYYSIEAWLVQNTKAAVGVCRKHHGARHVKTLNSLAPAAIEDTPKPKDVFCVRSTHNETLSVGFPVATVCANGLSLALSIEGFRQSVPFCEALRSCSRPRECPS